MLALPAVFTGTPRLIGMLDKSPRPTPLNTFSQTQSHSPQMHPLHSHKSYSPVKHMSPPLKPSPPTHSAVLKSSVPPTPVIPVIPLPPEDADERSDGYPSPVRLSPFLAASSDDHIVYDFSYPRAATILPHHPLFALIVSEQATQPPLSSLTVICPILAGWSLVIHPHSASPFAYITVLGVLQAIHTALRLGIHRNEYGTLTRDEQVRINVAYRARCSRIADARMRAAEREQGIKRVDLLGDRHIFSGLTAHSPGVWELHLNG